MANKELSVSSNDPSVRNSDLATQLNTLWVLDEIAKIEWVDDGTFKGWRSTYKDG